VKRTFTSKLPNMLGTQKNVPADGRDVPKKQIERKTAFYWSASCSRVQPVVSTSWNSGVRGGSDEGLRNVESNEY